MQKENNKNKINNVILSETKNLMRSFTNVQNDNQRGRSMVEMLGVLAIIGVLSVAGIAGYTNAMNKHKANELLNEAAKRAVVVSGQLLNRGKGNLGEFNNNVFGGIEFDNTTTITKNTNNQFELTFKSGKKPDENICGHMKTLSGENTFMKVADDCSKITFNADLSNGVTVSGGSSNCTPTCESTYECVDGNCIKKANQEDNSCAKNSDCNGKVIDGTTCNSENCYCTISAANKDTSQPSACFSDFSGSCDVVSEGTAPTGTNYKVSSGTMTWWSAVNFCKAVHGTLVSLSDVGCEGDGETPSFNDSLKNAGYPTSFWSSNGAINNKIGNTGDNTCTAFRVYVNAWRIDQSTRWSSLNAVCKQQ